ncbi:hypothetical protein JTT08_13295 [Clostridium botulinum]|nr:hypothetical protein [Clostridium botulinum]
MRQQKFYLIFILKEIRSLYQKLKISKDQIEEISKMQKDKTISTIKTNLATAGLKVNDEQIKQIYAARVSALKKLSAKAEVVSQDDKSAQVKLKATHIDEVALDEKAATDAVEEVKK